jgi:hypothetical protein
LLKARNKKALTKAEAIFMRSLVWCRRQRRRGEYRCIIGFKKSGDFIIRVVSLLG